MTTRLPSFPTCIEIAVVMTLALVLCQSNAGFAQVPDVPDSLSFQGMLTDSAGVVNATVPMLFKLYHGGLQVWAEYHPAVEVTDGIFDVSLGSMGPGLSQVSFSTPTDLGITVGDDPEITPRTRLLPAPYALSLRNLRVIPEGPALAPTLIGGWSGNTVLGSAEGVTISGGGDPNYQGGASPNSVSAEFGTIGGGSGNEVEGTYGTVSGGLLNTAKSYGSVGGGKSNGAKDLYGTVAGGELNFAWMYGFVGGGYNNIADQDYGAIGGGYANWARAEYSTIPGGQDNIVGTDGPNSTIGGGYGNRSGDGSSATIAGGDHNQTTGAYVSIGGGANNEASGIGSTIPGGQDNVTSASGSFAAGIEAHALHSNTFVWNDGTVGSDSLESTDTNQFLIGAGNGVGINTNSPRATLTIRGPNTSRFGPHITFFGSSSDQFESGRIRFVEGGLENFRGGFVHYDGSGNTLNLGIHDSNDVLLANDENIITIERGTGDVGIRRENPDYPLQVGTNGLNDGNGAHVTTGGTWTSGSSRTFKENLRQVNPSEILQHVVDLPLYRWQYRHSDEGDHMGPVAEDFFESFGLGDDDHYISGVDGDGVALAAIKGLYELVREQQAIIADQNARIGALEARLQPR